MVERMVGIGRRAATRRASSRVLVALSGVFWVAVLSGCAHYTADVTSKEGTSTSSAYLYGHFFVRTEQRELRMYPTVGFVITCNNGQAYTVRFLDQRQVQVIKIEPARCSLTEIVYTDSFGKIRDHDLPQTTWMHVHDFQPGRAYYLGDYAGTASYAYYRWHWTMVPLENAFQNYDATTMEMQVAFKALREWPTEDARLVPRAPRPAIEGAPISPEQAARIVRLTNRRYPGVAECHAACPTGECIPFRGESGPEIACINRCRGDKDCPTGLACNCAGDERADCHPIAAPEPGDRLGGLCLAPAQP